MSFDIVKQAELSAQRAKILHMKLEKEIKETGYTIISPGVNNGAHPFRYTIGLTQRGWPEIFLSGYMPENLYAAVIANVIDIWETEGPKFGAVEGVISTQDPAVGEVVYIRMASGEEVAKRYTLIIDRFFPKIEHSVAQVFIPDRNGFFPGDEGYSTDMHRVQDPISLSIKIRD